MNIKLLLQFHDYEVWTAQNGVEALNLLVKYETLPDPIISDIIMPKMNGYDLLQKVAENSDWNHIPFIFVLGRTSSLSQY